MSTLRGREREKESEEGETEDEHEAHRVREKAIQEEKEEKRMERTPRPEMGREWSRRWSVSGVSTPLFIPSFTNAILSLHNN